MLVRSFDLDAPFCAGLLMPFMGLQILLILLVLRLLFVRIVECGLHFSSLSVVLHYSGNGCMFLRGSLNYTLMHLTRVFMSFTALSGCRNAGHWSGDECTLIYMSSFLFVLPCTFGVNSGVVMSLLSSPIIWL